MDDGSAVVAVDADQVVDAVPYGGRWPITCPAQGDGAIVELDAEGDDSGAGDSGGVGASYELEAFHHWTVCSHSS